MLVAYWQVGRMFANGSEDQGSIPGRVISKGQKMVLDTSLFNTQYYNVRIKDKRVTYWPSTQPSIKEQVYPVEDIRV